VVVGQGLEGNAQRCRQTPDLFPLLGAPGKDVGIKGPKPALVGSIWRAMPSRPAISWAVNAKVNVTGRVGRAELNR